MLIPTRTARSFECRGASSLSLRGFGLTTRRRAQQRALASTPPSWGTAEDVRDAVVEGALHRVRPIMMTVTAIIAGLLPIMLGSGTGSEVMRRIAAPMVGGMVSATLLTLVVIPAVFLLWKARLGSRRLSSEPISPVP